MPDEDVWEDTTTDVWVDTVTDVWQDIDVVAAVAAEEDKGQSGMLLGVLP